VKSAEEIMNMFEAFDLTEWVIHFTATSG